MAVPNSETSTTDGTPVRSRRKSAAAIPPATVMPPAESPKAARCMMGAAAPGGDAPLGQAASSIVGHRDTGDTGDIGSTDGMTASFGGLAGTSR